MATLERVARENGKPMPLGKLVDVVAEVCLACGSLKLQLNLLHSLYAIARPSVCRPSVCPSVCRLSVCLSVMFVHSTQAIDIFGNVSMPFGTLAICDLSIKILLRSSQFNLSVGGVKCPI